MDSEAGREEPDPETKRLAALEAGDTSWRHWGPYLSLRQWGTVREDYSPDGDCWDYFPHDHARSRTYRWGEDGLLGLCDRYCLLCFSPALWNGRDPILKERPFGLTNHEGNHGEDVKECYYILDATPTSSYLKALYKYPQAAYPYERLIEENRRRSRLEPEFEITDTGIFDDQRYFDVFMEYAKASAEDVLIRFTVANRGPEPATLHLLAQLWFRNTWSWGRTSDGYWPRPSIFRAGEAVLGTEQQLVGRHRLYAANGPDGQPPELLFTENETNATRLFGVPPDGRPKKDAFHEYVVHGRAQALAPHPEGTKAAALYRLEVPAGGELSVRLRLVREDLAPAAPFDASFDETIEARRIEADAFYARRIRADLSPEEKRVCRQAFAGLMWSRQFYFYVVKEWLEGDPAQPKPDPRRLQGRNWDWPHIFDRDIIAVPDTWEYPWYAVWDLAFQLVAIARLDPLFAQKQLVLFLREWYMHPSGQLPAYEFAFSDANPPVHAWACLHVYQQCKREGRGSFLFLERCFQKLLINFTWWVNRKDPSGRNLFTGGFLGLDNIGPFDRSKPLPGNFSLAQADGTAWMAFYCLCMLGIALELAAESKAYEDVASKFFEHFVAITDAINCFGGSGLWNEEDGFYYDGVQIDGEHRCVRVRSIVGLLPLIAFGGIDRSIIDRLPGFRKRMDWFLRNRKDLGEQITYCDEHDGKMLLALPSRERLERVLKYLLDESEFLSPYGIRALSRYHLQHPFVMRDRDTELRVDYEPGDSTSGLFGGNSNWRGPVWFPVNYLIVRALRRYHEFYGERLLVECPTGSGRMVNLDQAADEISRRLTRLFLPGPDGRRPCHGDDRRYAEDPHWKDLILFYEYFHGDNGRGLGANHQTGWTALVALLLEECGAVEARG